MSQVICKEKGLMNLDSVISQLGVNPKEITQDIQVDM